MEATVGADVALVRPRSIAMKPDRRLEAPPSDLLKQHRGVAHVARALPVAKLGEDAHRVRLLCDGAATAVP